MFYVFYITLFFYMQFGLFYAKFEPYLLVFLCCLKVLHKQSRIGLDSEGCRTCTFAGPIVCLWWPQYTQL